MTNQRTSPFANMGLPIVSPPTAPFSADEQPNRNFLNGLGTRDFLNPNPTPVDETPATLAALMAEQNDYLQDIAIYLRRQNADILTTAVVERASQVDNAIKTADPRRITFQVGGKPVEIYSLLAYSTWTGIVVMSLRNMANAKDGIPFVANDVYNFNIPISEIYVASATASIATPLVVNGPADPVNGGFFLQGFTTPDWDRIRNGIRS